MICHTRFWKDWNYNEVKLHVKSASFSTDNSLILRLSIFNAFLTIKTLPQNISITLLQISLKLHEHRGGYWRKKLQQTILEEQFPVPRNTAASEIGNSVISLLWQLRPDVIATLIITNFHLYLIQLWWQFFQIFVYGDVVYAQTWEVLTPKNCIESP